ncbi:hypothetical protein AAVH_00213 [Aphelenchoides avenae]|nr:hypothetical protein AAVH_00213 [Aphelenchus avenae]
MATVFEPVNAEVRPAECHSKKSKKQKKVKKTKSQPKEDKTQERTVVEPEPEEVNRVQAQQPTTGHGSKEVTRKNGDMKSGARKKKKSRDSEDTEERISEKVPVAESPDETRRPVISKALKVGKSTYTIVYSTSHGRQIPRFVPDEPAYYAVRKPTAGDEKTAMEHNNGSSTPTPEGS